MRCSVLFLLAFLIGCDRSAEKAPVEFGHVSTGDDEIRGIQFAVADLNADPGRLPLGRKVEVRSAPAGTTPDGAAAQGSRLLALNKVRGLIGPARPTFAERVGSVAQGENGIVVGLSGWTGSPAVSNLYGLGIAPAERGRVLARTAKAMFGDKTGLVVVVRDPAAISANAAADRFVLDCRAFATVKEVAVGAKAPEADIVFFATPAAVALQQRRTFSANEAIFGGDEDEVPAMLSGGEGFVIATPYDSTGPAGRTAEFAKRYREQYKQEPTVAAALAYDAVTVWAEVARRADGFDPQAIRTEFGKRDVPFETLSGPLTFADDHSARRRVHVARTKGGTLEPLGGHDPEAIP